MHRAHEQGKENGKKYGGNRNHRPPLIAPQIAPGYFYVFVHCCDLKYVMLFSVLINVIRYQCANVVMRECGNGAMGKCDNAIMVEDNMNICRSNITFCFHMMNPLPLLLSC